MAGTTFKPGRCEPHTLGVGTAEGEGGHGRSVTTKVPSHMSVAAGAPAVRDANVAEVAVWSGAMRTSQAPVTSWPAGSDGRPRTSYTTLPSAPAASPPATKNEGLRTENGLIRSRPEPVARETRNTVPPSPGT